MQLEELAWLRDESFELDLIGYASELERLLGLTDGTAPDDGHAGLRRNAEPTGDDDKRCYCSEDRLRSRAESPAPQCDPAEPRNIRSPRGYRQRGTRTRVPRPGPILPPPSERPKIGI